MSTNVKILVGRPEKWIARSKARTAKIWFFDVDRLYNSIPRLCKELNIECEVRHIDPHKIIREPNTIYLAHHTYGREKNIWHIKKGYVPGYMYWDRDGYSGWSEAVSRYSELIHYNTDDTEKIIKEYIKSNSSKIKQPEVATVPDHPYVLVLGQRPHDTVSAHSYIDTIDLSRLVNQAYKGTGIEVYTKPHPMSLKTRFMGKTIDGSMHKLIAGAKAIYTVNSGSGFESLFHYKKVYTSGKCDYSPVTTVIKNLEDIKATMNYPSPNQYSILHYLTYCFTEHFVNCYDDNSIKRKLQRCVDEYEV